MTNIINQAHDSSFVGIQPGHFLRSKVPDVQALWRSFCVVMFEKMVSSACFAPVSAKSDLVIADHILR